MKKNLKGSIAILTALLMFIACFAACAPSAPASSQAPADSASSAAPAESSAAPAAPAASAPEMTLTLGHVVADGTPLDLGSDYFSELVLERSDGRIKIEVYPNSALGDNRAMLEALQLGTIDMMNPAIAPLAGFTDSTKLFDLPFLFKDNASAEKVLDGEVGQNVLKELEPAGMIGLAWFFQGWRHLTTAKTEVHTPADMKGLKIRTMENEIHIATFNGLGASAVPMAFSEIFTSLQQGILDGQENPISNIKLSGFYEVQGYIIKTGHIYDPCPVLMSQTSWDKLSPEDQTMLKECALEAQTYQRKTAQEMDDAFEKEIQETSDCKVIQLTAEERAAFQAACQPIYEKYAGVIGQDRIDAALGA